MPNSPHWSTASAVCRLELTPSRALAAAYGGLGVVAAFATWAGEMPRIAAVLIATAALFEGLRLARAELSRPVVGLTIDASGRVLVDDAPVAGFALAWRGPWAFLTWRARGRVVRRFAPPDVIDRAGRRHLRLAASRVDAPSPAPVAP